MFRTAALSAALLACALANTPQAQSPADVASRLVGAWRLVSWTQRLADGTTRPDPRNVGYIVYSDAGYVCYASMAANRPRWASANNPTGAEAVATMGVPFNSYCARVEVHADEGFILHHAEVDKSPNMIGFARKRWFTFQGSNRLALRMDPSELAPPVVESTLLWERVQK